MKKYLVPALAVAFLAGFVWFVWMWGFCRFYVRPGEMAVVISKVGEVLPPGQILARKGQQGIQEEVLGEGRHFLNPVLYEHKLRPLIEVPPRKVAVVTAKVGRDLPSGEFLADRDQKGIWRGVLGPGKYRLNPYGYDIQVIDAVLIPIGYVGVVTSLAGAPKPEGTVFAAPGQRGVREDVLQPGLYYINPKEYKVDILEIGVNQVSLLGQAGGELITKSQLITQNVAMEELQTKAIEEQQKKRMDYISENPSYSLLRPLSQARAKAAESARGRAATLEAEQQQVAQQQGATLTLGLAEFVEFPSRDGFNIRLDMTVEFEFEPKDIAAIFSQYGDLPAVVDKIIMPQITSISRNKGSEYRAKDFIVGEGREKFQSDLTRSLQTVLGQKKIVVHNALIRHVDVPQQILEPIQQASIAVEQDLTNKEKQNTAKKLAELNTELSLIEQRREQVAQETSKLKAEVKADQERQVAQIGAETTRNVAEVKQRTAVELADRVRKLGVAEAESVRMVDGERARGLQMKAKAFGDPRAYTLWETSRRLSDRLAIKLIHAGEGTLWTDLDKSGFGGLGGAKVLEQAQGK